MKQLLSLAALLSAIAGLPTVALADAERADVLRAINWVENPTNHTRRGAHGELGPYQFRANTWRLHTRKSFNLAVIREHADEVAMQHYEWIKRGLQRAGVDPHPYNIALAWNSGLGSVLNGKVPAVTYNYAQRVTNLVESQRAQRRAMAAAPAARSVATTSVAAPVFRLDGAGEPVRFTLGSEQPVFVVQTEPLYEPVVVTEKTAPARAVAVAPAPVPARPLFSLSDVASSGVALVLP